MARARIPLLVLPMLVVASCATGRPFTKLDAQPDQGVVYIYRQSSLLGAAVTYNVRDISQAVAQGKVKLEPDEGGTERVNDFSEAARLGSVAGVMRNGSYAVIRAGPGQRVFMAEYWGGVGSWGPTPNVVKIEVARGGVYFIHTSVSGGGRLHMLLTPADKATAEISSCHLSE